MKRSQHAPTHRLVVLVATVVAAFGGGCLDDLPSPTLVDDLRVLAVRAEPPEVGPGTTVALDALVVDPAGREITYAWYACLIADRGQGFFGGGGQTNTSGGNGTPLDNDDDGSSCKLKYERGRDYAVSLGNAPTASYLVPEGLLDDDEALAVAFGFPADLEIPALIRAGFLGIAGLNMTVQLVVSVDGRTIETTKAINVSLESPLPDNARNTNPDEVVLALTLKESDADAVPTTGTPHREGACFTAPVTDLTADTAYRLSPLNFPTDPIPYVVLLAGSTTDEPFAIQNTEESWFYSFFSTSGKLSKTISKQPGQPENTWTFAADEKGDGDFWMVVRDGRGGVNWCHERVTIP